MSESIESITALTRVEQDRELALLDQAHVAIAEATTVRDAKEIRDRAEALEVYAKRAEYGSILQQRCSEIKLRAERKAGELLRQLELKPGRPSEERIANGHHSLDAMGISRKQSSRWQKLATIPEERFDEEVREGPSEAALLRLARQLENPSTPAAPDPDPLLIDRYIPRLYAGLEEYGVTTVLTNETTGEVVAFFCDFNKAQEVADLLN